MIPTGALRRPTIRWSNAIRQIPVEVSLAEEVDDTGLGWLFPQKRTE